KFLNHKNISVYFDLNDIKDEKFDLIVMFHVLEHLLDPVAFLKNVSCYLKEKGSIIVEVPNVDDALVSFYNINEFKDFYFCTAHVSYFSMKTLGNCLMESGLKGDIFPVQRYNLNNHLHWLMHKKPGVLPEDQQIFSEETLKNYEKDLLSKNLSDTLWAVVEKNINIIGD
ncbi:MAG: methyltransferase domain-containing protein, partial [Alphaproteobacteria bacterium]|nr:methyltransferase domain-containing protein [Alphaproteobacteria bacterium]